MGGVDPDPVKTGQKNVLWTTERVDVNVQPEQREIHFDDLMSSDGVPLDFDSVIRLQVTVGRANPPDAIKTQRVETAAQEQRKTTMVKTAEAEIQRKEAEQRRAEADNAYRNAMGLSPDLFVQLESVKMQATVCAAPGAHCTFLVGDTDVTPVVNAAPPVPTN